MPDPPSGPERAPAPRPTSEGRRAPAPPAAEGDLSRRAAWAGLGLALVAAAALRLWALDAVPPGVHTDEAHNALDAWAIAGGWRPVFLPGNNGREPLFMYLMAAAMAAFGPTIGAARLAGATAGLAAVAATYAALAALPFARPRRVALLAAAFLALSFWPVAQARVAIRGGLLPMWSALLLLAWWRARDAGPGQGARRLRWAAAAGAALAGGLWTHLAGRLLPAIVLVDALAAWRAEPAARRARARAAAVALATATLLAAPLLAYFAAHPADALRRLDQVRLVGATPVEDGGAPPAESPAGAGTVVTALAVSAARLAGAPLVRGDRLWYHNLKGRPVWPDLGGRLAFLLGLVVLARLAAGRGGRRPAAATRLAIVALAVTAAPSWLSAGAPNFIRLTGTWPVLCLIPALGLDAALTAARRAVGRAVGARGGAAAGLALALAVLGGTAAATAGDYFGAYAAHPDAAAAFEAETAARGRALAALLDQGPTWVSPVVARQSILRLAALPRPLRAFDPAAGLVLPAAGDARYVLDPLEADEAAALAARWPALVAQPPGPGSGPAPLRLLTLSDAAGAALVGPAGPASAAPRLGDGLRLVRADLAPARARPGAALTVTLALAVDAPTPRDVNLFVHVLAADGRTVAQDDGPPLGAGDPSDRWSPATVVVIRRVLALPDDAPAGPAAVRFGLYDWRDGRRLAVPGSVDDAVELGHVLIEPAPPR